ncbi:unnamed protein product, partial [Polarella glacialis]
AQMTGADPHRALGQLTVAELRTVCKEQGVPHAGRKCELIDRLVQARQSAATGASVEVPAAVARREGGGQAQTPFGSGAGRAGGRGRASSPRVKSSPSGASSGRGRGRSGRGAAGGTGQGLRPFLFSGSPDAASRQPPQRCVRCEANCDMGSVRFTGKPASFWCPLCRFKVMDPFNELVEGTGMLKYLLVSRPQFDFSLDLPDLRQWKREGMVVEVRMLKVDSAKNAQAWPRQIHFMVNGMEVFAIHPPE